MRTRITLPSLSTSIEDVVMCDLERNDNHNYVKFHLVGQTGKHITGGNLISIHTEGLEFYFGICNVDNMGIDDNETLKVIGIDLL